MVSLRPGLHATSLPWEFQIPELGEPTAADCQLFPATPSLLGAGGKAILKCSGPSGVCSCHLAPKFLGPYLNSG